MPNMMTHTRIRPVAWACAILFGLSLATSAGAGEPSLESRLMPLVRGPQGRGRGGRQEPQDGGDLPPSPGRADADGQPDQVPGHDRGLPPGGREGDRPRRDGHARGFGQGPRLGHPDRPLLGRGDVPAPRRRPPDDRLHRQHRDEPGARRDRHRLDGRDHGADGLSRTPRSTPRSSAATRRSSPSGASSSASAAPPPPRCSGSARRSTGRNWSARKPARRCSGIMRACDDKDKFPRFLPPARRSPSRPAASTSRGPPPGSSRPRRGRSPSACSPHTTKTGASIPTTPATASAPTWPRPSSTTSRRVRARCRKTERRDSRKK